MTLQQHYRLIKATLRELKAATEVEIGRKLMTNDLEAAHPPHAFMAASTLSQLRCIADII
jgi:hypothetical protein